MHCYHLKDKLVKFIILSGYINFTGIQKLAENVKMKSADFVSKIFVRQTKIPEHLPEELTQEQNVLDLEKQKHVDSSQVNFFLSFT